MRLVHLSGVKSGCRRGHGAWHSGIHLSTYPFEINFQTDKYMATQTSGAFTDLGSREDLYYTDPDNCKVEAIPVEYNTRFSQNFTNLTSGSSTFIIPPKLLGLSF